MPLELTAGVSPIFKAAHQEDQSAMIRIAIPNMTCAGCAKGVMATLREAAPGQQPRIDLERREVVLEGDAAVLVAALRADGWEATVAGAA